MAIYDREAEQMARGELAQLQLERLQATLTRVYKNVTFYKKRFDAMGFLPEDCLSLEDLRRLPFTTRHDLARAYPYEMFAVPLREVVRIHSSTGSPGNPIVMGYTARDLRHWARLAARVLTAAGVDRDDVVQVTLSYGLLTSAFGLHYGVELLGASVIPTGPGATARQVQIMRDYRTTVLVSTPGYARIIADQLEKSGMDAKNLFLKVGLFAGEPWTEAQRRDIESRLFLKALDNYALSEAMGPGVAGECEHRAGMHVNEDHFLAEIIDPASGEVLPEGAMGELVLTTISREATPLVRFRTGDLTRLDYAPCQCGRTMARLSPHRRPHRQRRGGEGHQYFSGAGGADPGGLYRGGAHLPAGRGAGRGARCPGGPGGGAGGPVLRQDDPAAGNAAKIVPQAGPGHRRVLPGEAGGAQFYPAGPGNLAFGD